MCRDTEETAIKNIFLNHFLDCLRNARPIQPAATIELPQDSTQIVTQPIDNEIKPEDEFLGVIEATENDLIQIQADETSIQMKDFSILENDSFQQTEVKTTIDAASESAQVKSSFTEEIVENIEPAQEKTFETKTTVSNLSLPEKEPYQFSKCTVTTTIQLLPAGDDGATVEERC